MLKNAKNTKIVKFKPKNPSRKWFDLILTHWASEQKKLPAKFIIHWSQRTGGDFCLSMLFVSVLPSVPLPTH